MTKQRSPAELAAEASSEETLSFIRRVKRATRRKYTPQERVRVAEATYCAWKRRLKVGSGRLVDLPGGPRRARNRLRPEEEEAIPKLAQVQPTLNPREVARTITDQGCFSVSESTVYRMLKTAG